jgi:hypothetical protein
MQIVRKRRALTSFFLVIAAVSLRPAPAGEIAGAPPALLPTIDRDFSYNFSNDFFGRGGSVDDYRTQQFIISAKLSDKWSAFLDHSILTLTENPTSGRVDQLSASIGYSLVDKVFESGSDQLIIGGGLRSAGNFSGERMQNGFHRLIGSDIDSLPYVDTSDTAVTAWIDGAHYREFAEIGRWSVAYWLRATTLGTSSGEWDSSISALAVVSRSWIDIWLGLRHDWRSGYAADIVQIETAAAEEDSAVVFGVRFGAFIFETVQQLHNDASYGQIVLVSSGVRAENKYVEAPKIGLDFGFVLPDVEIKLAGKMRSNLLINENSRWRESTFVDVRYGKPQFKEDDSLYVDVLQIGAGLEYELPVAPGVNWLSYYVSLGAGWREEQLNRETDGMSEKSDSVGRAVVTGDIGLRFFAASMGDSWNYRLQLGISATAPLASKDVQIGTENFTLQKPSLGILLGMSFDYD